MKLLKHPDVIGLTAKSRSGNYADIQKGLMTPPVKLGERSVAWPEHEVLAINAARVAGKTDDEIRQLVTKLIAERQNIGVGVSA